MNLALCAVLIDRESERKPGGGVCLCVCVKIESARTKINNSSETLMQLIWTPKKVECSHLTINIVFKVI